MCYYPTCYIKSYKIVSTVYSGFCIHPHWLVNILNYRLLSEVTHIKVTLKYWTIVLIIAGSHARWHQVYPIAGSHARWHQVYRIYSAIRRSFPCLDWLQITKSVLWNVAVMRLLPFTNNPKDLDPSLKTDLDFWDCFGSKKTPSYNRRNTVNGKLPGIK